MTCLQMAGTLCKCNARLLNTPSVNFSLDFHNTHWMASCSCFIYVVVGIASLLLSAEDSVGARK